jgi:hypothetical protein
LRDVGLVSDVVDVVVGFGWIAVVNEVPPTDVTAARARKMTKILRIIIVVLLSGVNGKIVRVSVAVSAFVLSF